MSDMELSFTSEMSGSTIQALDYLEQLPGTVHKRLYQQPSTALAVFRRMLPHLEKHIVMAMLYMPEPFLAADLESWIRTSAKSERDRALSVLESLHIITTAQEQAGIRAYRLLPTFAASLRNALTGGGEYRSFGVPCDSPDKSKVDIDFLDTLARSRWESILYYMVGSTDSGIADEGKISSETKTLLELGNFVESRGQHTSITQLGFSFLLQEANAQVWNLLIVYLENALQLQMDPVDVLSFLFMLGSLELGQDYSTANLTATQLQMLDDLNDFGIIYRRSPESKRYYPTRLATTLTSDAGALPNMNANVASNSGVSGHSKGFIIVETNYRLYAYTQSPLQIAVLALFCRLIVRFPNMVTGKLTKESVQRAISYGITSDQIITYMTAHAHPQMQKKPPVLPPTVVDQIRLWQIEGDRMKATPGFLMKDFGSQAEYEDTYRYAESLGVLVWKSDARACFFVSRIDQLSAYLKSKWKRPS